jgi:heat shock protein HslJ
MRKPISRVFRVIALAVSAALALGACAPGTTLGGPDPGLHGQWELIGARDTAGSLDLSNQRISLTINNGSTSGGRSSCSEYTAQLLGTLSTLWIRATFPQYPQCGNQAQQDLEERYASDLEAVRSATATPKTLTLLAPGITLRFLKATTSSTADIVNRGWTLRGVSSIPYGGAQSTTFINISSGDAGQQTASLRFSSDGVLSGATGCRLFAGRYAQNAGEVVISKLSSIGNSTCNGAATAIDDYMLSVISTGFTFRLRGGVLLLSSDRAEINLNFLQSK